MIKYNKEYKFSELGHSEMSSIFNYDDSNCFTIIVDKNMYLDSYIKSNNNFYHKTEKTIEWGIVNYFSMDKDINNIINYILNSGILLIRKEKKILRPKTLFRKEISKTYNSINCKIEFCNNICCCLDSRFKNYEFDVDYIYCDDDVLSIYEYLKNLFGDFLKSFIKIDDDKLSISFNINISYN